jgi:hypothetical protein
MAIQFQLKNTGNSFLHLAQLLFWAAARRFDFEPGRMFAIAKNSFWQRTAYGLSHSSKAAFSFILTVKESISVIFVV